MRKVVLLVMVGVLAGAGVAAADEAKTRIAASMFLDLTAPRARARDTAYQESIR